MPARRRSSALPWVDPAAAFSAICGNDTNVFWLDSGQAASTGRSYLGRATRVVTSADVPSMLEFLRGQLAANRIEATEAGFALGWVGWLGYENRFETLAESRTQWSSYPDAAFLYVDRAVEFDHAAREVRLLSLEEDSEWEVSTERALRSPPARPIDPSDRSEPAAWAQAQRPQVSPVPEPVEGAAPRAVWRDGDEQYLRMIRECKARIAAGDAYLLCLTTEVHVDTHPDPVATYLALRDANPSHHGALLRVGDISLLSSSPEKFLSVSPEGLIESRPIKGTRPRGRTREEDDSLADELVTSEKERAENLMIVDLMRNDIGRVSRVGSVEVPSLQQVERYATVHQLVSTVRGQLADGLTGVDAVAACFPAGSMTGTPKISATLILDSLERHPRGIYSGAFGYFGLDGRIDLAMVIRSILLSPSGASIGTGGGITALSEPDEELAEVKLKAAALLSVLGVAPQSL